MGVYKASHSANLKGFCFEGQKTEEAAGRPITEELFLPGKP